MSTHSKVIAQTDRQTHKHMHRQTDRQTHRHDENIISFSYVGGKYFLNYLNMVVIKIT